ncbi:ATP synthase subunit delta, mitochondrial, partial [Perkinsus olseni]
LRSGSFQREFGENTPPLKIDSVTVPGTEGTFTITNNHSLVISQLSPGVITVRDGTEHKDFFISDGFIFFNQPSDGSGCCRAEISGVELVPKEALDKDRATQLLSEVQSAAKETEWDKVKAQLGSSPVGVPPTFGSLFTMDELHCKDNPHNYPCLEEMKVYRETQGAKGEDAVVRCASKAVADANDFHTLRNLSHVLLDMDTIIKVFDNSSSIVRVGIEAARKLTNHPDCLREFGTKDSLDCRCFPLYSKVAMLKYKNYGWWAEARQYFRQIQGFTYKGVPNPVGWEDIYRTPQIYIPNLRAHEIWPRGEWEEALPIGVALEQNYKAILAETKEAMRKDELWEDTYRFLYKNGEIKALLRVNLLRYCTTGTWKHLPIYHAREIIEPQCTAMPTLCGLVKKYLPTKPGLPWVVNQNEQVMVIRMDPGTTVETHNGPSNN